MSKSETDLIQAAHRAAENQRRQIELHQLTTEIQTTKSPVIRAICQDLVNDMRKDNARCADEIM